MDEVDTVEEKDISMLMESIVGERPPLEEKVNTTATIPSQKQ